MADAPGFSTQEDALLSVSLEGQNCSGRGLWEGNLHSLALRSGFLSLPLQKAFP